MLKRPDFSSLNTQSRVLLVDDDPACLDALSGTLQLRLGHFTLQTCSTGVRPWSACGRGPTIPSSVISVCQA